MDVGIVNLVLDKKLDKAIRLLLKGQVEIEKHLFSYKRNMPRHLEFNDFYQEAILVFIRAVQSGAFVVKGEQSIRNFMIQICKRKIQNSIRDNKIKKGKDISEVFLSDSSVDGFGKMKASEREHFFQLFFLEGVPESCSEIIEYRFYRKLRHDKIAEKLNLKSANSSKSKLADCIKKIRLFFNEKIPSYAKDLLLDF